MNDKVLEAKKQTVEELKENFKKSSAVIVCEYRGLTVADLSELRKSLREVNAKMGVYKNSLVERAAADIKSDDFNKMLSGPNAYIFSDDVCAGPKVVRKFAKRNEALVIKGGLLDGTYADAAKVDEIAKLPGKEGLISMFLSVLQAPIRNLAYSLKSVAEKQN